MEWAITTVSQAALLPRGGLGVGRGGPGYRLLFEILYFFIEFPEKIIRPCLQISGYYRKTGSVS